MGHSVDLHIIHCLVLTLVVIDPLIKVKLGSLVGNRLQSTLWLSDSVLMMFQSDLQLRASEPALHYSYTLR